MYYCEGQAAACTELTELENKGDRSRFSLLGLFSQLNLTNS